MFWIRRIWDAPTLLSAPMTSHVMWQSSNLSGPCASGRFKAEAYFRKFFSNRRLESERDILEHVIIYMYATKN